MPELEEQSFVRHRCEQKRTSMRDDLRVAVVGAGYWGRNLVRVFYELGVLDTVCEKSPDVVATALEAAPSFATKVMTRAVVSGVLELLL